MRRISELIASYLAMDSFARDVFLASAKVYARTRPALRGRRKRLLAAPRPLDHHPAPDGISDPNQELLVSERSRPVDPE